MAASRRLCICLALILGLHVVFALQVSKSQRGPFGPEEHKEAERLVKYIEDSIRKALPDVEFHSSFTAEDLLDMAPPDTYDWDQISASSADTPTDLVRGKREAESIPEDDRNPDDDAEEVAEDCGGEQPPATGLRRWVIRMRNIMFGRRDLEGTEGGEAEGEPEQGRTWVESLAHWFAHGIKKILVRFRGGDGDEAEGNDEQGTEAVPNPDTEAAGTMAPSVRRSSTTGRPSEPLPPASTGKSWTARPTVRPAPTTTTTTTEAPRSPPAPLPQRESSTPSATVYDDEAFGEGHGKNSIPDRPVHETNELN